MARKIKYQQIDKKYTAKSPYNIVKHNVVSYTGRQWQRMLYSETIFRRNRIHHFDINIMHIIPLNEIGHWWKKNSKIFTYLFRAMQLRPITTEPIHQKSILNSNLAKSCSPLTSSLFDEFFSNLAQSTAVILLWFVQNFRRIHQPWKLLWTKKSLHDLNLRHNWNGMAILSQVLDIRVNTKILSYQFRHFHWGDTTVIRWSYLHNGDF